MNLTQASVSAVHSTVSAPPSHTVTHTEDATQFDLNLEFAVSKLNEASVEEHAIAIKVASQGGPLSTCGDDDTEHALLAAIGRKSFAKGDHVDVQYPERVQPYHAIVTKASNKTIRVDFIDGSYTTIRSPFKAVTKVECSCDAFDADTSDSQHSADESDSQHGSGAPEPPHPSSPIPTPIKPEPPPSPSLTPPSQPSPSS